MSRWLILVLFGTYTDGLYITRSGNTTLVACNRHILAWEKLKFQSNLSPFANNSNTLTVYRFATVPYLPFHCLFYESLILIRTGTTRAKSVLWQLGLFQPSPLFINLLFLSYASPRSNPHLRSIVLRVAIFASCPVKVNVQRLYAFMKSIGMIGWLHSES